MTNPDALLSEFPRYNGLIEQAMGTALAFEPLAENEAAAQVERGMVFPQVVLNPAADTSKQIERLIELSKWDQLRRIAVVDQMGHHRPVYRGLLVYCWLAAFRIVHETLPRSQFGRWEEALRAWCDLLESELAGIHVPPDGMIARQGTGTTELAWNGLALHIAGKIFIRDAWTDLAADAFGRLMRGQRENGAFLLADPSDNPETHGYHELVILHAAASYAVQAEDRTLAAAVARNTEYHQNQTQPDHATTQPWGLFAFIWNPSTRPLADQLLHSAHVQHPGGIDGVSLMLLADALYCLRLFI